MRKYKVLYLTGNYREEKVIISSPYYFRVGQRSSNKDGYFRVLEVIE